MEGQGQPEQFRLRELDEVVVPVEHGRFVIKADQEKFKRRVLAPFPAEKRSEIMQKWTFKSLHLEPMRTFMDKIHADAPWKTRLMVKLDNLFAPPVGLKHGAHVNLDVGRMIRRIDGLSERYTDEEKEILVKQTIDAMLRHEEQHIRQDIRNDEIATGDFWKLHAVAQGGLAAGFTGAGVSVLLMGYQRFAEAQAAEHLLQQLSQSRLTQEALQALAQAPQTDTLTTAAVVLPVASIATLSGSLALYCLNHRYNYRNTPREQDAKEQEKPQYFSEKSPLEVSFERGAQ
jgi:hypothetical protein